MRHFVRRHHLPVAAVAPIEPQLMSNGGVEVVADGNPYQLRPGLPEIASRLLRDLHVLEQRWPEIFGVQLDR